MVLIIDDDKSYANMIAALDSRRGYSGYPLYSVARAIDTIKANLRDVECVILDIMMPPGRLYSLDATKEGRYTGVQVFATIRTMLPKVPIFITTVIRDANIIELFEREHLCQLWLKDLTPMIY